MPGPVPPVSLSPCCPPLLPCCAPAAPGCPLACSDQTRTYWFNPASLESEVEYALVGAVLGLAIYNGGWAPPREVRSTGRGLVGS